MERSEECNKKEGTAEEEEHEDDWWRIPGGGPQGVGKKDLGNDMNDMNDLYCGDLLDKSLIQYCFLEIIQANLGELQATWNTHIIQSKPAATDTGRRPIRMYTLPQLYNAGDQTEIAMCADETVQKTSTCTDETISDLCSLLMAGQNLMNPMKQGICTYVYDS